MNTERKLTDAQRRALLWLVPGAVCADPPRHVWDALNGLILYRKDLVGCEWGRTAHGRPYLAWRLTDAGVAVREGLA